MRVLSLHRPLRTACTALLLALDIFLLPFHVFLLLTKYLLALFLIKRLLALIGDSLLFPQPFLLHPPLFFQRMTLSFLTTANDFFTVFQSSPCGTLYLLLHIAATYFMLIVFAAGIAPSFAIRFLALHIGAGTSRAVASAITRLFGVFGQFALLVKPRRVTILVGIHAAVAHVPFVNQRGIGQALRFSGLARAAHIMIDDMFETFIAHLNIRVVEFARHDTFRENVLAGRHPSALAMQLPISVVGVKIRIVHGITAVFPTVGTKLFMFFPVVIGIIVDGVDGMSEQIGSGGFQSVNLAPGAAESSEIRHGTAVRHQTVLLRQLASPTALPRDAFHIIFVLFPVISGFRHSQGIIHMIQPRPPFHGGLTDVVLFILFCVAAFPDLFHNHFGGFPLPLRNHLIHFGTAFFHRRVQTVVTAIPDRFPARRPFFSAFAVKIRQIIGKLLLNACQGIVAQSVQRNIGNAAADITSRTVAVRISHIARFTEGFVGMNDILLEIKREAVALRHGSGGFRLLFRLAVVAKKRR